MRFSIEAKPSEKLCYKKDVDEDQQQYVRIAARISNNDTHFLALLNSENALWTPDRRHGQNKDGSYDWGFCGINEKWHPDAVNDERFFTDPEWQIQKCYDYYKGGVTFYGNWKASLKYFECP